MCDSGPTAVARHPAHPAGDLGAHQVGQPRGFGALGRPRTCRPTAAGSAVRIVRSARSVRPSRLASVYGQKLHGVYDSAVPSEYVMSHDQRNGVHEPRSYLHSIAFVSVSGCVGHLDSSRLFVPKVSTGFRLDAASAARNSITTKTSPRRLADHAGRDLPAVFGSRSTCTRRLLTVVCAG